MLHLIISSDLSKSKLDFFPMESLTHPCLLPGAHRSSSHQSHPCSLRVHHTRSSAGYTCHRRIGTGADGRRSEENDLQPQQQTWRKTQESASLGNAESKTRFATSSTASTGLTTSSQFFFWQATANVGDASAISSLSPFTGTHEMELGRVVKTLLHSNRRPVDLTLKYAFKPLYVALTQTRAAVHK